MPDPKIAEFCRSSRLSPAWIHGFQRHLREVVQPKLDRLDLLEQRVDVLRNENRTLAHELAEIKVKKRGPGRPKKVKNTVEAVAS